MVYLPSVVTRYVLSLWRKVPVRGAGLCNCFLYEKHFSVFFVTSFETWTLSEFVLNSPKFSIFEKLQKSTQHNRIRSGWIRSRSEWVIRRWVRTLSVTRSRHCLFQCPESGSTGSTCFWPPGTGSFYHQAIIVVRKTLILLFCDDFVWIFFLWKSNKQKNFF